MLPVYNPGSADLLTFECVKETGSHPLTTPTTDSTSLTMSGPGWHVCECQRERQKTHVFYFNSTEVILTLLLFHSVLQYFNVYTHKTATTTFHFLPQNITAVSHRLLCRRFLAQTQGALRLYVPAQGQLEAFQLLEWSLFSHFLKLIQ